TFAPELPVIVDRKSVGFILYPRDQAECLRRPVNGYLHILVIQSSRTMMVIFDHAAYRYVQMQFVQYLKSHVYLALSSVHEDQIRKHSKFPQFLIFFPLSQPMGKTPGQHLSHAAVVIRSLDPADLKFTVVMRFGFPLS